MILNVPLAGSDDVDVEANGAEGNAVESNGAGNCGDDDDDVLYIEPNEAELQWEGGMDAVEDPLIDVDSYIPGDVAEN